MIPPRRSAKHWKFCYFYNGFFEKASETWQSNVTKCVSYCTMLQTFVVLCTSLTQQAVRTRTTRSKGRVSPHVPLMRMVATNSFLQFDHLCSVHVFLSSAPRRSRAEHPATNRAAALAGAVRSPHTRGWQLSIPCFERSTIWFPFIPPSIAQGYLRLD